jgi:hypothetical protein
MNNQLQELLSHGAVILRDCLPKNALNELAEKANAMRFSPFSYSFQMASLVDSGALSHEELLGPVETNALSDLITAAMGHPVACDLQHSWLRKRFAPCNAPRHYHPNSWHQDGGLGVNFTPDTQLFLPMTQVVTYWIPLQRCGRECPSLELILHPLDTLLHYTELEDEKLRRRFPPDSSCAAELDLGDALILLPGTLHQTYELPEMTHDRLSLEYRFFAV